MAGWRGAARSTGLHWGPSTIVEQLEKARQFGVESWAELRKVTWPDYDQLKNATLVIIVFVILVSLVIWLMDLSIRTILDFVMGLFGA